MIICLLACTVFGAIVHVGDMPGLDIATWVVVDEGLVYVVSPKEWFLVMKVEDGEAGIVGSYYIPAAAGGARAVHVESGYAYILGYDGVVVVNVRDPAHPQEASFYAAEDTASMGFSRGVLYLQQWGGTVSALNVTTPTNPVLLGQYHPPSAGPVCGLAVVNNTAYVVVDSTIVTLDCTDPADLVATDITNTSLVGNLQAVLVHNGLLYISGNFEQQQQQTSVYNVSSSPLYIGSITGAGALYGTGDTIYATNWMTLYVYDMTSPEHPVQVLAKPTPGCYAYGIYVAGDVYAACANGLSVIPLHDRREEVSYGTKPPNDLVMQGDYVYYVNTNELQIADISDLASPRLVSQLPLLYISPVYVANTTLLVADPHTIYTIDVTDPSVPRLVASEPFFGAFYICGDGDLVYVSSYYTMQAYRLANHTLTPLGNLTGYFTSAHNIVLSEGYLFMLTETPTKALMAFDVADPFDMYATGALDVEGGRALAVVAGRAYYVLDRTIYIVNTSDPVSMFLIASQQFPEIPDDPFLAASGRTVYVSGPGTANSDGTLLVLDVSSDLPSLQQVAGTHLASTKVVVGPGDVLCVMSNLFELWAPPADPSPIAPRPESPVAPADDSAPHALILVLVGMALLASAFLAAVCILSRRTSSKHPEGRRYSTEQELSAMGLLK